MVNDRYLLYIPHSGTSYKELNRCASNVKLSAKDFRDLMPFKEDNSGKETLYMSHIVV
jgi:hypothetical protein